MFEAKLAEGMIFKKIIEAIKDLVTEVNLDVSPSGKYIKNKCSAKDLNNAVFFNYRFKFLRKY